MCQKQEAKSSLATGITKQLDTLEIVKGRRPEIVSIKDRKVNFKSLLITMSIRHRVVMILDLIGLSVISCITTYFVACEFKGYYDALIGGAVGVTFWIVVLCKTITDFRDWLFTMNSMNEQMASWALEDVIGICQDFISAGVKLAAEEVQNERETKESMPQKAN